MGCFLVFKLFLFLVFQIEGPKSPEEMLTILQRVLEESAPVLVSARLDAEERRTNMRLREEQDAAYQAALEADQVCFLQLSPETQTYVLLTISIYYYYSIRS